MCSKDNIDVEIWYNVELSTDLQSVIEIRNLEGEVFDLER